MVHELDSNKLRVGAVEIKNLLGYNGKGLSGKRMDVVKKGVFQGFPF